MKFSPKGTLKTVGDCGKGSWEDSVRFIGATGSTVGWLACKRETVKETAGKDTPGNSKNLRH